MDTLADLLHTVESAPAAVAKLQRNTYETLLHRHDWLFASSDDHNVYARGFAQRKELEVLRREIDPGYAVWNQFAPASCHNGGGAL